jgi:FAD/FMN-containing dehydrogenase
VVAAAAQRGETIRVAGSGHSFTALCEADGGALISLDGLRGVVAVDGAAGEARVRAGTKLWEIGEPLRRAGFAMANMGDIDRQSLAGAISTGTHGTGRELGNLSSQVCGLRIVGPEGKVRDLAGVEALRAARLALGALGVLSEVRLRVLPAYRLHEKTWTASPAECLAELDELIAGNRHFEFFWDPTRDRCLMKALNPTSREPDAMPEDRWQRIDHSDRVFPTPRETLFNEIEFSLPAAAGPACFEELRALMLGRWVGRVAWPLEYRTLASDDAFLSPAHDRETVAISAHQAAELPYEEFFADVEAVFRGHGGRPHWGKVHALGANDLAGLYPRWSDFQEERERVDPGGVFLNRHLRRLFVAD